jgi:hypothetical protein
MDKSKIIIVLNEIIENYLIGRHDRLKAIDKLITSIDPGEVYDIESNPMITDCYFAIKHLTEEGYETTNAELIYLRDCINGVREYDMYEKNKFISQKHNELAQ